MWPTIDQLFLVVWETVDQSEQQYLPTQSNQLMDEIHSFDDRRDTNITSWHRTHMWLYGRRLTRFMELHWQLLEILHQPPTHEHSQLFFFPQILPHPSLSQNISLFGSWCLTVETWCYRISDRRGEKKRAIVVFPWGQDSEGKMGLNILT